MKHEQYSLSLYKYFPLSILSLFDFTDLTPTHVSDCPCEFFLLKQHSSFSTRSLVCVVRFPQEEGDDKERNLTIWSKNNYFDEEHIVLVTSHAHT